MMEYALADKAAPIYVSGVSGNAKLSQVQTETELCSLLATASNQAIEIRQLVTVILDRVRPQGCDEGCAEKQCFSGGYVGQAEMIRSTQRETLELLSQLAKFA